jgi:glutaredoxin
VGSVTEVVLYTRPGCHLCDEARDAILALRDEGHAVELREVDIEPDERLHAELAERIPVVEVAGEIVSELVVDVRSLRSRLDTVAA